jgi:hypothetical protein
MPITVKADRMYAMVCGKNCLAYEAVPSSLACGIGLIQEILRGRPWSHW